MITDPDWTWTSVGREALARPKPPLGDAARVEQTGPHSLRITFADGTCIAMECEPWPKLLGMTSRLPHRSLRVVRPGGGAE